MLLLLRHGSIRINSEHEGEEYIDEVLNIRHAHFWAKLSEQHAHQMQRPAVGLLERYQKLLAAVGLHVIIVHGEKF